MNIKLVEDVAAAVLYEGYILYPYRASAIKNKQRWTFGVLYPRAYAEQQSGADAWSTQTECLLRAAGDAIPKIRVRFLHLAERGIDGQDWQAAIEREITLDGVALSEMSGGTETRVAPFHPEENQCAIEATVETTVERLQDDVYKLRVRVFNTTALRDAPAIMQSLVSTHALLSVDRGEFISLLEPAEEYRALAAECRNVGTWPVLAGVEGERDAMLSSPIILYDYPQIAPESPGALFDGTEIDEILTLRIMTLTDAEKAEMSSIDDRTREILERTESMPVEQFMKMHGVMRAVAGANQEKP